MATAAIKDEVASSKANSAQEFSTDLLRVYYGKRGLFACDGDVRE